jgi:hypothetical protein
LRNRPGEKQDWNLVMIRASLVHQAFVAETMAGVEFEGARSRSKRRLDVGNESEPRTI